jgi:hypothetical protein
VENYDVIIIGAGPIGLIAAKEALRQNKKVLLMHKPENQEHLYSPDLSVLPKNELDLLRSIGGTANAWHGQGMRFPRQFFLNYFKESKYWTYERYLQLSQEVEQIFGMKIVDDNDTTYFEEIKKRIPKNARISLKVSHVPRKIANWHDLFAGEIKNKNLNILKESVASLSIHKNSISCINTSSGKNMYLKESTLVILAGNPLGIIELLMNTEITNSQFFPGIGNDLFDHPHAITQQFEPIGDINFLGNTFKYPICNFYRTKIKKKFVVSRGNQEIGIFELNPVYSNLVKNSILMKIFQKFIIKLFGKLIPKPDRIDVWVQIEKTKNGSNQKNGRVFYIDNGKLNWTYEITAEDLLRFDEITTEAITMLEKNGFKLDTRFQSNKMLHPKSAFHPSGTIKVGYDLQEYSFNYEGFSNKYRNLMVGGSALIGAGSWINPTLPIMTIMLGNIREALSSTF